MRSRYTAYALGDVLHLIRTTDPEGPHHRADRGTWAEELRAYCAAVDFVALEVLDASAEGDEGFVHFRAHLEQRGQRSVQEERSRFRRRKRRWLYTDGTA
jgi:SEC-C motif-containing protein